MGHTFVGRQTELAFLDARLDEACQGGLQLVLLSGPSGVGKTALLGAFLARADHWRVLCASGEELEAGMAYGVVEQLIAEVGEPLSARLAVLGTEQAANAESVWIGAGLVDMLSGLEANRPIILVVDDAHWADVPSLQALGFALRRLRAARVLALLVIRDIAAEPLPASLRQLVGGQTGVRLRLAGLQVAELRALSRALGVGALSRRAATRLRDHTDGSPLHARALLEQLPAAALHHNRHPLPAPRSLRKLVIARLASCSADAKRLVEAASVLGNRCPLKLAGEVAEVDKPLVALEQAIKARLLEERSTATERLVAFRHPLVRAAVYHDLGPAGRAGWHARAARLVAGEPDALRHRVAAASGPDPGLAAEAVSLAGRQAEAGAWTAAADILLAAAGLNTTQPERERQVLEGVEYLLLGGAAAEATAFAKELGTFADSARRDYILARLAMVRGRHADAEQLLAHAWRHNELATEFDLAAAIAGQLSLYGLLHAQGELAVTWARRALAVAPPHSAAASNLLDILMMGLVVSSRPSEALALAATLPDPSGPTGPGERNAALGGPRGLDGWIGRGVARAWTDDLVGGRADLAAALAVYRHQHTPLPWGLIGLGFLAEIEYQLGAWDDAIGHAELAVSLTLDSDQDWLAPFVHAVAALPLAARGEREAAQAHFSAAAAQLQLVGTEDSTIWVATAQALLALADGDHHQVAAALKPIGGLPNWTGADESGWLPWLTLAAEAQVALGRNDDAERILVPFEELAAIRGRRSALAAAARARGVLEAARGHSERAEAAFRAGLTYANHLPMPFDRALLEAAYGRFLRRLGRRGDAIAHLEMARARLVELNARPYLERCDRELTGCGRTPARRQPGPRATLTPQEQAVVRLVAGGRTNRQAAAELVVSVKTIEYHLGNAYAKLGVTSRTQLTLALHRN